MNVFEQACAISNSRWADSLPYEFETYEFSKQHQKRMKTLFDKMRGDKYHRFTKRVTALLIAAAILISMTITALAIPVTRKYIINNLFDHSLYTVLEAEETELEGFEIDYIPEGFELEEEQVNDAVISKSYKNSDGRWFDVLQYSIDDTIDFDTENRPYEEIEINGITYIYCHDNYVESCIWNDGVHIFSLSGNISKDELIKIVQSIK